MIAAPHFVSGSDAFAETWPSCGGSITKPYTQGEGNEQPYLAYEDPPLGYAAWKFTVEPDAAYYPLTNDHPVQIRLLNAPVPDGIMGQKMLWQGAWFNFGDGTFLSADVAYAGDVLFLPMQPARPYTIEARQMATNPDSGLPAYSEIVSCTVTVGYALTAAGVYLDRIDYRASEEL